MALRSLSKKKKFPGVDIDKAHKLERICKCGNTYTKFNSLINKCVKCLIVKGKQIVAKETKKAYREQKEKLKTIKDYREELKKALHLYVRMRDKKAGHTCICCDRPLAGAAVGGAFDAGHFRPVSTAPHLRFDERNIHAQTKYCNKWKGGRYFEYEKGLRKRIGDQAVDELKADETPRKYCIDELKALRDKYRVMTKALKWNKTEEAA